MMNGAYHLAILRLRAEELERNAARFRSKADRDRTRPEPQPAQPVTMRLAVEADATRLAQIAGVARKGLPRAPLLIGEIGGRPVAAVSLSDGAIVSERLDAAREVVALLRFRASQLRRAGA
jgi:hypothetical protein